MGNGNDGDGDGGGDDGGGDKLTHCHALAPQLGACMRCGAVYVHTRRVIPAISGDKWR